MKLALWVHASADSKPHCAENMDRLRCGESCGELQLLKGRIDRKQIYRNHGGRRGVVASKLDGCRSRRGKRFHLECGCRGMKHFQLETPTA